MNSIGTITRRAESTHPPESQSYLPFSLGSSGLGNLLDRAPAVRSERTGIRTANRANYFDHFEGFQP